MSDIWFRDHKGHGSNPGIAIGLREGECLFPSFIRGLSLPGLKETTA